MRLNVRDIISAVVFYGAVIIVLTLLVRLGRTYGWAKVDQEFKLMEPTLARGHYKWINKQADTVESLRYNDLIMFESPPWKRVAWDYEFGRVIGLPGDLVEMRYGQVHRTERTDTGLAEPEQVVEPYVPPYQRPEDFGQFIVPRKAVFILFDQRRRRPPLRELIVPQRAIYGRVIR